MLGIKIYNQLLDLTPGTVMQIVLNNPAFLGDNIDKVFGSFSFPVTIPLTDRNRKILNFPDLIDVKDALIEDELCEIISEGLSIFSGLATIKNSGNTKAKLFILIDSYKSIKQLRLPELNLGRHEFDSVPDVLANAKDTTINPLNYDYAFFPVLNKAYFSEEDRPEAENGNVWPARYMNYYDVDTEQFVSSQYQKVAMPFVRVDHILNAIGNYLEFSLESSFQNTDELKQMYVYNDRSIYQNDTWNIAFDLANHVPDVLVSNYLKGISRLFCLAPFINRFSKKIEIIPLKDIITRPFKHDWTDKASSEYTLTTEQNFPGSFGYDTGSDELFEINAFKAVTETATVEKHPELVNAPQGWYYVNSYNTYVWSNQHPFYPFGEKLKMFRRMVIGDGENVDFNVSPLFQQQTIIDEITQVNHPLRDVPEISQAGLTNKDIRLMMYRGLYANDDNEVYPFASNNIYDPKENVIPSLNNSLLWNGPKGMFETWWKEWVNFLQNKKDVQRTINLHIKDILNFSFKDKVKIENKQYLVKQLTVSIGDNGLLPTKSKLASVL